MAQTKVKSMVEGGILSAVAVIFALISVYIPVLGAFVNIIWPVPLVLLGVRHGYKWSIMATIVSGAITAMLAHPLHAVSVVVGFALIGIVLGHCLREGFSPVKTMLYGSAASLVSKAAVLAIGMVFLGVNPLNIQDDAMIKAVDQAIGMYRSLGMKEEELAKASEMMRSTISLMKVILPAGFAIAAVFDTYLNFLVAKVVLKKLGHQIAPFPPFKLWNFPYHTVYVWGLSLGALYWANMNNLPLVSKIATNLQVIATAVLLVQGLALFYFVAGKYNLPRLARSIILILIFSNGLFTQIVVYAGAFDMILDYRRLRTPRRL